MRSIFGIGLFGSKDRDPFWRDPADTLHGVLACLNRLQQFEILCGDGLLSREYSALDDAILDAEDCLYGVIRDSQKPTQKI